MMSGNRKRNRSSNFLAGAVDDTINREISNRSFGDIFNDDTNNLSAGLERVQSSSLGSRSRSKKNSNLKTLLVEVNAIPSSIVSKTIYDMSLRLLDQDRNRSYSPQPISLECSLLKCRADTPYDQEGSSYKEVKGSNVLEILGAQSSSSSSDKLRCVIERDGVCKFQFSINKTTSHDEHFILCFNTINDDAPIDFQIFTSYSNRFSVYDFGLEIVHPLPEVWFKDQGGKENSLDLTVKLVTSRHVQVPGVIIPLKLMLLYGNGEYIPVPDQNLLKFFSESKPSIEKETGEAQMRVRIEDVSKNHQSRPFAIKIEPDPSRAVQGQPNAPSFHDIGSVITNDVHVRSKPTKSSAGRETISRPISVPRPSFTPAVVESSKKSKKSKTNKRSRGRVYDGESDDAEDSDDDEYDPRKRTSVRMPASSSSMVPPLVPHINENSWQTELFSQIQQIRMDIDKLMKQQDKLLQFFQDGLMPAQSPLLTQQHGAIFAANPSSATNIENILAEGFSDQQGIMNGFSVSELPLRQQSFGRLFSVGDSKRGRSAGESSLNQLARIADSIPQRQNSLYTSDVDGRGSAPLSQSSSQIGENQSQPTWTDSSAVTASEPLDTSVHYILMVRIPTQLLQKINPISDVSLDNKFYLAGFDQGKRLVGFYLNTSPSTPTFSVISDFKPESIRAFEEKYQKEMAGQEIYMDATKSYKSGSRLAKFFFSNGFPPPYGNP